MTQPLDGDGDAAGDRPAGGAPLANASGRQLLRNFLASYLGLAVSLILSLFLTPVVLHHLGTTNYGLWIAILAIGGYLTIVDAGVSTAAVQQVARAIATRDDERLAEVLATARAFFIGTALLAVVIALLLVPFMGDLFHPPAGTANAARICMILSGFVTALYLVNNTAQVALFGGGRNSRSSLITTAVSVVLLGGQIVVVLLGGGLIGLFAVAVAGAVGLVLGTHILAKRIGLSAPRGRRPTRRMFGELLRAGGRNVLISVAGTVAYGLDVLIIGLILPIRLVTPYDIALSTAGLSQSVSGAGTNLLLPTYSHASALGDREGQFRMYSKAVMASMAIGIPLIVAVIAFGPGLLSLWLGVVPPKTYEVVIALNVVTLLQLPGGQSFLLLIGMGKSNLAARIALPASVVNLALSVVATFWVGPLGPALGSLPQVLLVEAVALPVICCRLMGASMRRYLREAMMPLIAPTIAAVLVAVLLAWLVGTHGKIASPCSAVAVSVVGWAAAAGYVLRTDPSLRSTVRRAISQRRLLRG